MPASFGLRRTEGVLMATIDWPAAITALDGGGLPASGGERRVLRLAASLADGIPVDLRDAFTEWTRPTRPTSTEPSARCSTPPEVGPERTRPGRQGITIWPWTEDQRHADL
jgi:hypothetical protein